MNKTTSLNNIRSRIYKILKGVNVQHVNDRQTDNTIPL